MKRVGKKDKDDAVEFEAADGERRIGVVAEAVPPRRLRVRVLAGVPVPVAVLPADSLRWYRRCGFRFVGGPGGAIELPAESVRRVVCLQRVPGFDGARALVPWLCNPALNTVPRV